MNESFLWHDVGDVGLAIPSDMPSRHSIQFFRRWLRLLVGRQRAVLGDHANVLHKVVSFRLDEQEREAEESINEIRGELEASIDSIQMRDFGAGTRGNLLSSERKPTARRIREIYKRAAASPNWGLFMFRLARALNPQSVLELGTNLGVSALHIAAALEINQRGARLITIEGDPTLSEIARTNIVRLGHEERATVLTGRFDDILPDCLEEHGPFDLVFIDGHHEEAATHRYFEMIKPYLMPGACVAFDDIEPFRPVRKAWKRIIATEPNSGTVDLLGIGLWFAPLTVPQQESDAKASAVVQ